MTKNFITKKLVVFVLAIAMMLGTSSSAFALYSYDCFDISSSKFCYNIVLEKGDKVGYSDYMYLAVNEEVSTYIETYSDSVFQMGIELQYACSSSGPWTTIPNTLKTAAPGGNTNNGGTYTINTAGYFRVKVTSGDSSQGRSHGEGNIIWYND